MNVEEFVFGIFLFILCFCAGCTIGHGVTRGHFEREAIKHGHAEYVLKGSQGVWQWKGEKE